MICSDPFNFTRRLPSIRSIDARKLPLMGDAIACSTALMPSKCARVKIVVNCSESTFSWSSRSSLALNRWTAWRSSISTATSEATAIDRSLEYIENWRVSNLNGWGDLWLGCWTLSDRDQIYRLKSRESICSEFYVGCPTWFVDQFDLLLLLILLRCFIEGLQQLNGNTIGAVLFTQQIEHGLNRGKVRFHGNLFERSLYLLQSLQVNIDQWTLHALELQPELVSEHLQIDESNELQRILHRYSSLDLVDVDRWSPSVQWSLWFLQQSNLCQHSFESPRWFHWAAKPASSRSRSCNLRVYVVSRVVYRWWHPSVISCVSHQCPHQCHSNWNSVVRLPSMFDRDVVPWTDSEATHRADRRLFANSQAALASMFDSCANDDERWNSESERLVQWYVLVDCISPLRLCRHLKD